MLQAVAVVVPVPAAWGLGSTNGGGAPVSREGHIRNGSFLLSGLGGP